MTTTHASTGGAGRYPDRNDQMDTDAEEWMDIVVTAKPSPDDDDDDTVDDDQHQQRQTPDLPRTRPRLLSSERTSPTLLSGSSSKSNNNTREANSALLSLASSVVASPSLPSSSSSSRLFAPYRTVGVISSGGPFFLVPHQSSAQAMVACPIGDRFQLLQTDRLHPVFVSQAVTLDQREPHRRLQQQRQRASGGATGERRIQHVVTDPSLSITFVTHGATPTTVDTVTLYARTQPIASQRLVPKSESGDWSIQDIVSMGRISIDSDDSEKHGRTENAAIVAVILAKCPDDDDDDDEHDDDDESDSEQEPMIQDEDDNDESEASHCMGQIVVFICTRTSMRIQRRIWLRSIPTFRPTVAVHPATYLNKIVVGGQVRDEPNQAFSAVILVNIRSGKVVHNFTCVHKAEANVKVQNRAVTTLEQAPALDTIAVGTNYGHVYLMNLKHDKVLFSLHHAPKNVNASAWLVQITSLSFRTDSSAMQYGIAPLAVGRSDGTITIWDLTAPDDTAMGRTILCEMDRVHAGGVAKLQYFPQEPLLISTGRSSNAIRMHIFDNPDYSARLLRQRQGHMAPPSRIRYLHAGAGAGGGVLVNASDGTDASSCQILSSGGMDRTLRVLSTARSVLDAEYSQGPGLDRKARKLGLETTAELLLPPLVGLAMSEARSREWGDLVTIHQDHSLAYVWSTRRKAQSGPVLRQLDWNVSTMKQPPPRHTHATAVAMSACGSFALIGTRGGTIYRYNVQSGIARGSYPRNATHAVEQKSKAIGDIHRTTKALEKTLKTTSRSSNLDSKMIDAEVTAKRARQISGKLRMASHTGSAVTGIAVDIVNKTVISVGADAKLILWNFQTHAPHKKSPYSLPGPATRLCHVRDSDLAAIALSDFTVVLFDCTALSVVRRFGTGAAQHMDHISDMCFSSDGRTLYTASMDCTIRVWDVPTNKCVDWLGFQTAPTSLTMSPTGEFLATTHVSKLGISIWSDKSFYQTVHMDGAELTQPAQMDDPIPIADVVDVANQQLLVLANVPPTSNAIIDTDDDASFPVAPREVGLITLSGLPQAHWKNLFQLELVKSRNKPVEPPKKPPSAPFFLQWRSGEALTGSTPEEGKVPTDNKIDDDEEEWAAAWTDDGPDGHDVATGVVIKTAPTAADHLAASIEVKRRKVTHHRSHLAHILKECSSRPAVENDRRFQPVTDHMASLGPSAIDVAISTLCNGMHDLGEGLPLLILSCQWLLEACASRERFEAVNAYLHRFLFLHAITITGIEENPAHTSKEKLAPSDIEERIIQRKNRRILLESVSKLKLAQYKASEALRDKMEHTLCLLRHFSRMV